MRILIQEVWGEAEILLFFLTSSQLMLMLLVWQLHFEE